MLNEINTNIQTIYNEVSNKLLPRNIRKGVTILNVEGTLEGALDAYIVDTIVSSYTVTKPDSGSYTFALNSNGYYESNNKGVHNSYALCKVQFNVEKDGSNITFDCINYGESNFDYGIFSQLDGTLSSNNTADSNAYFSFSGKQSSSVQQVIYNNVSKGTHSVYIKYRKDGSVNSNNDTLQFKLLTEDRIYKNIFIYNSESAMQDDITQPDGSLGTISDGMKLKNLYKYNASSESWNIIQDINYSANRYETTTQFRNDADNYGSDFIGVVIEKNSEIPINIFRNGSIKADISNDEVYLDYAVEDNERYYLSNTTGTQDDYHRGAVEIELTKTKFKLTQYTPLGEENPDNNYVIEYDSEDGVHYLLSKSTATESIHIDNTTPYNLKGNWDDRIGNFLYTIGNRFVGLYYKTSKTGSTYLYNTQLYANQEEIPNGNVVYGNDGVVTGSLYSSIRNGSNIGYKLNVYNKLKEMLFAENVYANKNIQISGYNGDTLPITEYKNCTSLHMYNNNIKNIVLNLTNLNDVYIEQDNTAESLDLSFTSSKQVYIRNLYRLKTLKVSGEVTEMSSYLDLQNMGSLTNIDTSNLTYTNGITSMSYCFAYCNSLVNFPEIDTSAVTSFSNTFRNCSSMTEVPNYNFSQNTSLYNTFYYCTELVDASNTAGQTLLTTMSSAFRYCAKLETVPQYNLSNFTGSNWSYCFQGCTALSDESLNNILGTFATVPTSVSGTKTLAYIGLTQEQAEKCTTMSNYEAFTNAGWTTGY